MDDCLEQLVLRLLGRGMRLVAIPTFIKDSARVVLENRQVTCGNVAFRLEEMGWPEGSMDELTLKLLMDLLEESQIIHVERARLH
jgi:hypothetical protein